MTKQGLFEHQLAGIKVQDVQVVNGVVQLASMDTALVIESEFVSVIRMKRGTHTKKGYLDAKIISSGLAPAFLRELSAKITSTTPDALPPIHYTDEECKQVHFVLDDACEFYETPETTCDADLAFDDHVKVMFKIIARTAKCPFTHRERVVVMPVITDVFCPIESRQGNRGATTSMVIPNGTTVEVDTCTDAPDSEVNDDCLSVMALNVAEDEA